MAQKPDKSANHLVLTAGAATVALAAALSRGWEPGIPGEWVWDHNALGAYLVPALVAGLLLVGLVALLCRRERWSRTGGVGRAAWLAALVLVVLALQWALLTAVGPPSVSWAAPAWIIASPNATTYFAASLGVGDVTQWVTAYPQHMAELPYHAQTHPPGFVLLFLFLRRAAAAIVPHPGAAWGELAAAINHKFVFELTPSDAVAAVGGALVLSLAGALSLIPLYFLGRDLAGERAAVCSTALMAGMPGLLLLGASGDQIILFLATLTLWLCYGAWKKGGLVRPLLAGIAAGVGLFFSLGFAVIGAWLVVWLVLGLVGCEDRKGAARRVLIGGGAAAVGFVGVHILLYWLLGYRPVAVAQQAFGAHRDVTAIAAGRTYWTWVLMNPVEAAVFAGLPLVIAAAWSVRAIARDSALARVRACLAAGLIVLVMLDLSGAVRGEVGRIWLFLFWPAALAAGAWLASRPRLAAAAPLLVLLLVVQALLMRGYFTIYSIL